MTATPLTALLLFSHGSLLCGAGKTLRQHADALDREGLYFAVRIGYLNFSEPRFAEAVDELVLLGATEILILPYFLVAGRFVTQDLPPHIDEATLRYPRVIFRLGRPLLADPLMAEAVIESATSATPLATRTPTTLGTEECEKRPDCPLYGTRACPRFLEYTP